jgi:hypothetical protein
MRINIRYQDLTRVDVIADGSKRVKDHNCNYQTKFTIKVSDSLILS